MRNIKVRLPNGDVVPVKLKRRPLPDHMPLNHRSVNLSPRLTRAELGERAVKQNWQLVGKRQ